ncbi:putative phage tail protein [Anaerovorax odorimutans]|uniref:putative phage tail protein n=1 Tax=Anaerovorax odorimutans TaxID=109327 RepID=UPI000403B08D|nr:putative phage tail protein [Anaerovorax odorimutans]
MIAKERLINNLNKLIRQDEYIQELCKSIGTEIDVVEQGLHDLYNQFWFDTMTWGADVIAKQLNIKLNPILTQAEKNSLIEARWKNSGKSDIELLQNIADSWKNGEINVSFIDGKIIIKFIGEFGTPTDLESLKVEIDKAKPCHLLVNYVFKYLLIKDIHNVMTINQLQAMTLDNFAG